MLQNYCARVYSTTGSSLLRNRIHFKRIALRDRLSKVKSFSRWVLIQPTQTHTHTHTVFSYPWVDASLSNNLEGTEFWSGLITSQNVSIALP